MATPKQTRVAGITLDSPVGIGEIAVLLAKPANSVHKWRTAPLKHDPFPAPQPTSVAGSPWWRWGDVREWAERTRRLPESDPVVLPERVAS